MQNTLLTSQEYAHLKFDLPEWTIQEKKICREWEFGNFIDAFGFMTKVAIIAQSLNHHPDWSNAYSFLKIELTTHDLGGLSKLDTQLAKAINEIK